MKKFLFGISRIIFAVSCLTILSFQQANAQDKNPLLGKKVLVFSSTKGYRHGSIGSGKTALMKMAKEKGFQVDTTENATVFTENNLKQYRVVVFLNTTGNILNIFYKNKRKFVI